jgi:DNA-binding CsgD family transcriptional regulator
MQSSNAIIIHSFPIIQIGLGSVLNSLKIDVRSSFSECPDIKTLTEDNDVLLLIDVKYHEFIKKHQNSFRRRGISIVGLDFDEPQKFDPLLFDHIIQRTDNQNVIFQRLNKYSYLGKRKDSTNHLSQRETDVLKQIAQGYSNKVISENLFISIHTVITHRKHITSKLGIKSISGLTLYAVINNMID